MKFNFFIFTFTIFSFKCENDCYKNPFISKETPEFSLIKDKNNNYFLFTATENIYRSRDLVNWEYFGKYFYHKLAHFFGYTFSEPYITKQDTLYILYFSLKYGFAQTGLGAATSSNLWKLLFFKFKRGTLFLNNEIVEDNSIKPHFFQEGENKNKNKYIIFRLNNGIYGIELHQDGIKIKNDKFQLAGKIFDLPYIYKRNNYYYLFASIQNYCESDKSKQIVVGRGSTLKGNYISKSNESMLNNSYEIIIGGNNNYDNVGIISIVNETERTWIIFHAVIKGNSTRYLCIDELKWDENNWPYLQNESASFNHTKGFINLTNINTTEDSNEIGDYNESDFNDTTSSYISNKSEYIGYLNEYIYDNYYTHNVTSGIDLEIEVSENILFSFTTTDNQKNEDHINKTTINLGDCEERLKIAYNISLNDSLYIIKLDIKEEGMKIPKIEYTVYYPLDNDQLIPLNLSVCQNTNINISIPIKISEDINGYNITSNYYNDICAKATSNSNTDITLSDRKTEYIFENMTLCEEDCILIEYNYTIEKAKCSCPIKKKYANINRDSKI